MQEVAEGDLDATTWPTVLFYHTDELEITELADAETNPPENYQDNGATQMVNTQSPLLHSPPRDNSFASAEFPPRPCIKESEAAFKVREEDLLDVGLLCANYILYGVYQDWVHQSLGYHLDGEITENSKWQAR